MTTRPVHVVVVAYHAANQLDRSLAALGSRAETTVIDNSGSAAVRAVADARGAEYIDVGKNVGFGAGANVALRRLLQRSPRDVLLLNPDAALGPRDLDRLCEYMHRPGNERLAAVSPRLIGTDGVEQRAVWPFPNPGRSWLEAIGLGRLSARRTFVIGAVLLLRWEALREVGLFDERFFLYAEEADWQRRAVALDWSSHLCPDATAEHVGAGASVDLRTRETLFHAAQETYIRKWYGRSGWFLYRGVACFGAAARALVLTGERRSEAGRRAVIYLRGPRRCAALVQK
jgi:GT2 family glycosyltransferase